MHFFRIMALFLLPTIWWDCSCSVNKTSDKNVEISYGYNNATHLDLDSLFFINKETLYFEKKDFITLKKNISFKEQVCKANTIYELLYDFDLSKDIVSIPDNCVLFFNGGCLSNGTIIGHNTDIRADRRRIFRNVTISEEGTWLIQKITSEWFDFKINKNDYDNSNNFKNLSNLLSEEVHNTLVIERGEYWTQVDNGFPTQVKKCVWPSVMVIKSNTDVILNGSINLLGSSKEGYNIFYVKESCDVSFTGGTLRGDVLLHNGDAGQWGCGIHIAGSKGIKISRMSLREFWGDGVDLRLPDPLRYDLQKTSNVLISNCQFDSNRRNGLSVIAGENIVIEKCRFTNTGVINGTAPKAGIDLEPNWKVVNNNHIYINDCFFENNTIGLDVFNSNDSIFVDNCVIKDKLGLFLDFGVDSLQRRLLISNSSIYGGIVCKSGWVSIQMSRINQFEFSNSTYDKNNPEKQFCGSLSLNVIDSEVGYLENPSNYYKRYLFRFTGQKSISDVSFERCKILATYPKKTIEYSANEMLSNEESMIKISVKNSIVESNRKLCVLGGFDFNHCHFINTTELDISSTKKNAVNFTDCSFNFIGNIRHRIKVDDSNSTNRMLVFFDKCKFNSNQNINKDKLFVIKSETDINNKVRIKNCVFNGAQK